METAPVRPSQPAIPPNSLAPPKLAIEKFADGAIACLRFAGTIDEGFEGKKLGATAAGDTLVIDLGGVKKISSFGIREWVDFISTAAKQVRQVVLIECAPKVVDQLNMVANFAGGGRVFSFYSPFRCDYCDSEHRVLLQVDKDHETIKSMKMAERPCPSCKESMYFDEDGAAYFSFVLGQEKFELEPDVAAFLAAKLSYTVSDLSRKLRVDKVIEGRTTYLRLAGDLDRSFPREKLAEGLEGVVLVDLQSVGRIEPAGAAEWRGWLQMTAPLVEQTYLAAATPAFLEKLCAREDLGPKAQVISLTLPYACATCATTTQQLIDVAEHHAVLKFATAPELRCTTCKHPLSCVAGEGLMTVLPSLVKPTAPPELVKAVGILRERAIREHAPARKGTGKGAVLVAPGAQAGPAPRNSIAVPILAALLAVVLAAGGYLAYQRLTAPAAAVGLGELADRSAAARPAWIASDSPGTAACTDSGKGVVCVGVSSASARQDDAEDEAADAALDAAANALAVRISDPKWKATVLPLYAAAREAKLGAFDRDPSSTSARREVREARHAVGALLRATSGGAVPAAPTARYWEAYANGDGKRFLAFAEVSISGTELAKLVEGYAAPQVALGATAVGLFPLVGWRFPKVDHGAIVTALASGPLQDVGIAEQYIVLAVDGRDVADAATFAKLATDEHASLVEHGGTLRLKVQAADGAPREFAATVRPDSEPALTPDGTHRPHLPHETGSGGGVNVWDKYGGNRGSGRDDPTQ